MNAAPWTVGEADEKETKGGEPQIKIEPGTLTDDCPQNRGNPSVRLEVAAFAPGNSMSSIG